MCEHGEYSVGLPLKDGSDAVLRGLFRQSDNRFSCLSSG